MRVFTARCVLPVSGPPWTDGGAVAVENGAIVAVGTTDDIRDIATAGCETIDLGDAVLMPGLVNAHTHLELGWLADDPPRGGDMAAWVRELLTRVAGSSPDAVEAGVRFGIDAMLASGTVAVADVGNGVTAAGPLAASRLCGTLFHEIYRFRASESESAMEQAAARLQTLEETVSACGDPSRWSVAPTPHGPHTTSAALLKALAGRAAAAGSRLSIHVAESPDEVSLLQDGSGSLADLFRERGNWDDDWTAPGMSPVAHLDRLGVLSNRTLAVHCVHVDHQDLSRLQTRGVTVVACPRSNAYLGVGTAPIRRILASGIPVALGTDSPASGGSLDMFAEMAALRRDHPGLRPAAVVRMATLNGARALGLDDRLGTLQPGKRAAMVAVLMAAPGDDPLETVTSGEASVRPVGEDHEA